MEKEEKPASDVYNRETVLAILGAGKDDVSRGYICHICRRRGTNECPHLGSTPPAGGCPLFLVAADDPAAASDMVEAALVATYSHAA